MAARRVALSPPVIYLPKASLDLAAQSGINPILKQLKSCTRRLQTALAAHALELRVLERLYYKGKNQHRTALFWRNVAEMRRYGERVEGMGLYDLVERMRVAFWGEAALQNAKLLKGSWTHCPDSKSVLFVLRRCSDAHLLLEKARDRLSAAYHSFALVMQTAAFLQLILTLAAIASRLSSLLSEIHSCVGLAQTACLQLLQILDSKLAQDSRHLVYGQHHAARETESVTIETSAVQDMSDHVALDNADEDVGAVLVRRLTTPIEATSAGTPADAAPLLHEDLNLTPAVNASNQQLDDNRIRPADSIIQTAAKRKNETEVQPKKSKKKSKKKRDEIDDIFGL